MGSLEISEKDLTLAEQCLILSIQCRPLKGYGNDENPKNHGH